MDETGYYVPPPAIPRVNYTETMDETGYYVPPPAIPRVNYTETSNETGYVCPPLPINYTAMIRNTYNPVWPVAPQHYYPSPTNTNGVVGFIHSNMNPHWSCGDGYSKQMPTNVCVTSGIGSFQELLRNASTGALHLYDNLRGCHEKLSENLDNGKAICAHVDIVEKGNPMLDSEPNGKALSADVEDTLKAKLVQFQNLVDDAYEQGFYDGQQESENEVADGAVLFDGISIELENEVDDGYLGGHEGGDVTSSVCNDSPVSDCGGWGNDEIEDVEIEELEGCNINNNGNVHLGDCACITDEGIQQDCLSQESDSSNSDSDDDITIVEELKQEFYVDLAQVAFPYRKRKRASRYEKRPNCRKGRLVGAIERAIRGAATRETEHIFEPILGMVFDSTKEARDFYNMYSWEVGFGVKFNHYRPGSKSALRDPVDGDEAYRSMQEIVCQRSGYDPRITKGTTRCGCPAKIRLLRTDDHGWYISLFEKTHNHPFFRTNAEKREWNSHRELDPQVKSVIKELREANITLTKIHCIVGNMFGCKGDVPWTRRALRTVCNQITRDQMDDDIKKTMEIFKEMHEKDPGFNFSVELDKSSRIRMLLWCSGRAREQYACFGDVVTFDTTYCTNTYKMPFGLFVGVNNHFQTTIFAGVLMRRETAKSFKWVFTEFLKLMGAKAPLTILTDQCKAMTKAIGIVMPDTYHLWCKWHVMKKIRECLGPLYTKNKKFRDEFWLVVNGMLTVDEFEGAWEDLVNGYKLQENGFMKRVYSCKRKWAKPWSKDKFCARMSSTQRSESANFMLKRYVPRDSSMNRFVSQYNKLLYERDREEDIAEHKTKQVQMVYSKLWAIERHALSIYTKAAFDLFKNKADKASNYKVTEQNGNMYTITHDNAEKRARWARVQFKVEVRDGGQRYVCECGLSEHFGFLCCHSIRLLLKKDIGQIPDAHIMKRWTKNARDVLPTPIQAYQKDNEALQSSTFRNRLLRLQSVKVLQTGDTDVELFDIMMKHMKAAEKEAEIVLAERSKNAEIRQEDDSSDEDVGDVQLGGVGVQSDGELLRRNKYGASGSSAHYSDTEIAKFKAPVLKKMPGCPRSKRFFAGFEKTKKWNKKSRKKNKSSALVGPCEVENESNELETQTHTSCGVDKSKQTGKGKKTKKTAKPTKREIKCGKCGLKGHNSVQCCSMEITEETAGQYL